MPRKAARNCTRPGCPGLVRDGVCGMCGPKRSRAAKRYDEQRGSAASRGYDARWRKLRRMVLRQAPLCRDCLAEGRTTTATEVHHIVAKRDGGTDELGNLQALCKPCHSRRTAAGE